jgi:Flp pilus assembly protein TadD
LGPATSRAQWLEARILLASGHAGEALNAVEKVLEREPRNSRYAMTKIAAMEQLGNFVGAPTEARRVVQPWRRVGGPEPFDGSLGGV